MDKSVPRAAMEEEVKDMVQYKINRQLERMGNKADCRQCKFFKYNDFYKIYNCNITHKPFYADNAIPACEMFVNKNEKGDK